MLVFDMTRNPSSQQPRDPDPRYLRIEQRQSKPLHTRDWWCSEEFARPLIYSLRRPRPSLSGFQLQPEERRSIWWRTVAWVEGTTYSKVTRKRADGLNSGGWKEMETIYMESVQRQERGHENVWGRYWSCTSASFGVVSWTCPAVMTIRPDASSRLSATMLPLQ